MSELPTRTIQQIITRDYKGDGLAFLADIEALVKGRPVAATKRKAQPLGPLLIDVRGVKRNYKLNRHNTVTAVNGVDLQIHEGEIVALTGSSGSGKSTLLHLIAGLDKPSEGEVIVGERSIGHLSEGKLAHYRNETVGVVFQFFYLQPFLTVNRNVEVPLMFARTKRRTRKEPVAGIVSKVGLTDRAPFLPKELSGGQMQRVAIARALVNKPQILLADEPTGNLDSKNSDAIMELLQTIRDTLGTTIIVVTHDPRVAQWADRTVRLEDGKIAA